MNRFRLVLLAMVLVALAWLLKFGKAEFGRVRHPEPKVWAVGDTTTLRRDDEPGAPERLWDGTAIHLAGARNEVVAWQVALRPVYPVADATVRVSPFKSTAAQLPESACQAFREWFIEVKVPSQISGSEPALGTMGAGWYANQLLPLATRDEPAPAAAASPAKTKAQAKSRTAAPKAGPSKSHFDANLGETTALWFDLTIPEDAPAGHYAATISLNLGLKKPLEIPVELDVYAFALPREIHFRNWFYYGAEQLTGYYGNSAQAEAVEQALVRLAHDHRINLTTEVRVPLLESARAEWWDRVGPQLDGRAYDRGPCRGAAAPLIAVALPSTTDQAAVKSMAKATVDFFGSHGGGLADRLFLYTVDEPATRSQYDDVRRVGAWVHDAVGRRLPVMVTAPVTAPKPELGSLEDAVDIFCSAETTPADVRRWRERGGHIWVYNGGWAGPPLIDCPLLGIAAWGAAQWRFGTEGWFMWDALYWRQKHIGVETITRLYEDPLTFDETLKKDKDGRPYPAQDALRLNGDGVFFYPGDVVGYGEPLTCVRAKAFRRGAQDYEYLWLLANQGRGARADRLVKQLVTGRKQWDRDPDAWTRVRAEAAEALTGGK